MVTETFDANADPKPKAAPAPAATPRQWTNRDGQTMSAIFKGLDGSNAVLVKADGQTFRYPLAKLFDESQADIRKLSSGLNENRAKP